MEPNTIYVDWADLEAKLSNRAAHLLLGRVNTASPERRPRLISTIDDEVKSVRRNVKDSTKTLLAWVSAVANHNGSTDLNDVLNRCLRPGPDIERVNYVALANQIRETMHVTISAKRVKTAIDHLRRGQERKVIQMQQKSIKANLDTLRRRLRANFIMLVDSETSERSSLRRSIATDVLAAVRCAAGRVIDSDYGEGIPSQIDLDCLEDQFLDFVRDVVRQQPEIEQSSTLADDLHQLLLTLCDYDTSGEYDMNLVVHGSRVVADLMGPESLPGMLAQLNVLVAGRNALDTEIYCGEMLCLADATAELNQDPQTARFINWVRRLPKDRRVPSPLRVSSYCLNNVATHILERVFKNELEDVDHWMKRAKSCLDQMSQRDGGFRLIKMTHVQYLTVKAKLTGVSTEIEAHFSRLGRDAALRVLQDLVQYDNYIELFHAAEQHAIKVLPKLKHQLILLG